MPTLTDKLATEQILDAAQTVFNKYGVQKTTIEDIARSAGKAKSSLYYYFRNKDEIFQKVILRESELFFKQVQESLQKEKSLKNKLMVFIKLRLQAVMDFTNQNEALKSDIAIQKFMFIEDFRKEQDGKELELLIQLLKDAVAEGEIAPRSDEDLEFIGHALLTAIKGFDMPFLLETKCSTVRSRIDLFTDIFLNGITKASDVQK